MTEEGERDRLRAAKPLHTLRRCGLFHVAVPPRSPSPAALVGGTLPRWGREGERASTQQSFSTKIPAKLLIIQPKSLLTAGGIFVILLQSAGLLRPGRYCDEAGDCSEYPEVTSVEYVRCRLPWRHAIGRLRFSEDCTKSARISFRREETGQDRGSWTCDSPPKRRFVFRPKSDTHGMVERKFHPCGPTWQSQCCRKNGKRKETHPWQARRSRSASVSRPTITS